jgi:hypothetical protein
VQEALGLGPVNTGPGYASPSNNAVVRFDAVGLQGVTPGQSVSVSPYFDDLSFSAAPWSPFAVSPCAFIPNKVCPGANFKSEVELSSIDFNLAVQVKVVASTGARVLDQTVFFNSFGLWQEDASIPHLGAPLWDFVQSAWTASRRNNITFSTLQLGSSTNVFELLDDLFTSFLMVSGETYSLETSLSSTVRLHTPEIDIFEEVEPGVLIKIGSEFIGSHFGGGAVLDMSNTLDFGGFLILDGPVGASISSADGSIAAGQFTGGPPPNIEIVPEPGTAVLLMISLGGLALIRRPH